MSGQQIVYVYFDKENFVKLRTDNGDELIRKMTEKHDGWFSYEGITINLSRITHLYVKTPKMN